MGSRGREMRAHPGTGPYLSDTQLGTSPPNGDSSPSRDRGPTIGVLGGLKAQGWSNLLGPRIQALSRWVGQHPG